MFLSMLIAIIIVSSVLGSLILVLYFNHKHKYDVFVKESEVKVHHVKHSLHDIREIDCRIPKLELWNSMIKNYYKKKVVINCGIPKSDWLFFDPVNQQLKVASEIRDHENDLRCKISFINRVDDMNMKITKYYYEKFPIVKFDSDFFDVDCEIVGTSRTWSKYFMRSIIDKEKVKKLKKLKKPNDWTGWNVHIISYDSLSQMAFRRQLPKTVKFFESHMNGIVMDGYNIVGDGTPQAFIPILTGKTELELPNTRKADKNTSYVDEVYPFVWKNFSDAGYITLYGEDAFRVGTFSYRLNGFKNQPTDHFPRTSFQYTETKFGDDCFGKTKQHKEWLQYSTSFIEAYNSLNVPRFTLLHHSALSHDHVTKAENGDEDLYNYLKRNFDKGNFKNDIVILMADHGHRFSEFRSTQQGQLEEKLPFMGISLPESLKRNPEIFQKIKRNLEFNKNVLTTPFDLHATLLNVLSMPHDYKLDTVQSLNKRSLTMLRAINKERTCYNAGIEAHWCTCMKWKDVSKKNLYKSAIMVIAKKYVEEINKELMIEKSYCAPLELEKVIGAQWLIPEEKALSYRGSLDFDGFTPDLSDPVDISEATYRVKFMTKPGGAIYEITTLFNFIDMKMFINMWNLSHVNSYGDIGHCMEDRINKLATYCVCYDKIEGKKQNK